LTVRDDLNGGLGSIRCPADRDPIDRLAKTVIDSEARPVLRQARFEAQAFTFQSQAQECLDE
jgi:hypothetical protein